MLRLLNQFESKSPEIIFEWNDSQSKARGWVVINSLRGGAAGGGTRMRKGLTKDEVISLAKTMEIKFTVSGPAIGGAKAGIDFDPSDPQKEQVLNRWYKAVLPLLKNCWGTGGDLNVDEVHEVIRITEALGLDHPQEGIVIGHKLKKESAISHLRSGVKGKLKTTNYSPSLDRPFVVADMATGYGVCEAAKHFYALHNDTLKDKKVIIQGFGNVGAGAAFYLTKYGAKIVGIIDRETGIISDEGLDEKQIVDLFLNRSGNMLNPKGLSSHQEIDQTIWDTKADIFIPAAASKLVSMNQMKRLIKNGLEMVCCGANVPFADPEIFYGPTAQYVDSEITLIPDFIANAGMARVFAYLMREDCSLEEKAIFDDISNTMENALKAVFQLNPSKTGITRTGFEIALDKVV